MLLRAAQSQCWRPALHAHLRAGRAASTRPIPTQLRTFARSSFLRAQSTNNNDLASKKDAVAATAAQSLPPNINAVSKPEDLGTPKKDALSESAKATKDQRKADWAIMREMAKYLWPKVLPLSSLKSCTGI